MSDIRVGVIGGGASGMTAAILAARQGASVTLLERNSRIGKKLLSTGNGKCNLGNVNLNVREYYSRNPKRLEGFLNRFGTEDGIRFFNGLGVLLKTRGDLLYPACEQAAVVLDALRYELYYLQVQIVEDYRVSRLKRDGKTGIFRVSDGTTAYEFDRVILCCGGRAAPRTGSDGNGYALAQKLGHSLIPTVPALVQLTCAEDLKSVAGVRADARIDLFCQGERVASERGELQLVDYGLSGIPVFQLSRQVNYILQDKKKTEAVIDFLPDYDDASFRRMCALRELLLQEGRTVEEFFTGLLHKKLMLYLIRTAGLKPGERMDQADPAKVERVYELCRRWRLSVNGSNSFEQAQACAGGIPLSEVTDDLESVFAPGLYFAGEILDVDGRCGGYNLHWAWCSGSLAGAAAAKER